MVSTTYHLKRKKKTCSAWVRGRSFATQIQLLSDMLRRVREMMMAKSIREVTPVKHSISFITGDAPPPKPSPTLHPTACTIHRHDAQMRPCL